MLGDQPIVSESQLTALGFATSGGRSPSSDIHCQRSMSVERWQCLFRAQPLAFPFFHRTFPILHRAFPFFHRAFSFFSMPTPSGNGWQKRPFRKTGRETAQSSSSQAGASPVEQEPLTEKAGGQHPTIGIAGPPFHFAECHPSALR